MSKPAPTVYVPVAPVDNGVTLPSLFSIVVHVAIVAFVIFAHRIPKLNTPPIIETSIITPEELSQIQSTVAGNRKAASLAAQTSQQTSQTLDNDNDAATLQTQSQISTKTKPDNTTDRDSQTHEAAKTSAEAVDAPDTEQKTLTSEDIAALEKQLEEDSLEEHQRIQDFFEQEAEAEKQRVEELKDKTTKTELPPLKQPKRSSQTADNNKPTETTNSGGSIAFSDFSTSSNPNSDSNSNPPSGSSSSNSSAVNGGSSRSNNSSNNIPAELVNHIDPYWHPPNNHKGSRLSAAVSVDANGNVLSVRVNSDKALLKASLEQAIKAASPLKPLIGTDIRNINLNFEVY